MPQKIPQGQRGTNQEVVAVVLFQVLVRLDPLHHLRDERSARLLLVRVVPQHIDVFLFPRDLDDRLDERGLAKVKGALALRAGVAWQILPERMVVAAVDELEYLCQAAHAAVLVREGHTAGKRQPHVFVVERERFEEGARLLERLKVSGHERAPKWGRLAESRYRRRRLKGRYK